MTYQRLMAAITAAGCFPQLRQFRDGAVDVDTVRDLDEDGYRVAPLIRTFIDRQGRWVLTVFGECFYHVPDPEDVPAATLDMLQAMDECMTFSPDVIRHYNRIRRDSSEFRDGR
jgi:hypothetical protein